MPEWRTPLEMLEVGKGRKLTDGEDVAIVTIGHPGNFAQDAIKELQAVGLHPAHYDMRFVKPIDEEMLHEVFSQKGLAPSEIHRKHFGLRQLIQYGVYHFRIKFLCGIAPAVTVIAAKIAFIGNRPVNSDRG